MTRVCRLVRVAKGYSPGNSIKDWSAGPSPKNQHWGHRDLALVLPRSLVPCHYTNFKIKHVADIGVTKVLTLVNRWPLICQFTLVKRTSIGKDKILSSRRAVEGTVFARAISSSSLIPNRDGLSVFAQSKTEALATARKSVPRGIFSGFPDESHYYSLC